MHIFENTADFLRASRPESSTLLFCEKALSDCVAVFLAHFPGTTTYAVKANPDAPVLSALYRLGITEFDAASIGEIANLRELVPAGKINFNNPIRTARDLEAAYGTFAVRSFVIDDAVGLAQLSALGATDIEVTVRLKLAHENAAYNFGSKFGAAVEAAPGLLKAARHAGFQQVSMAFHPGSQCSSVEVYEKYIDACASVASEAKIELARLNVGGGYPVTYADSAVPPLVDFFAAIGRQASQAFGSSCPPLLCEPGRALVGPSCSLACQVTHVREDGPVFISDGVYGSLQEQFLLNSRLPIRIWRNAEHLEQSGPERELFGPTCDPSDKLAARYQLRHDIQIGDTVEFGLMGAYSTATATRFNGLEPAQYAQVIEGFSLDSQQAH